MNVIAFTKNSVITFFASILNLLLGILVSVIIARLLGPEGKGVYTLATTFSYFMVMFGSLGLPSAIAFYAAQQRYPHEELLGNSVLLSILTGVLGMIVGLVIVALIGRYILPDVPTEYLLLALLIIPLNIFVVYLQYMLLGAQHIEEYNLVTLVHVIFLVILTMLFLWIFKSGVAGALIATVLSWVFVSIPGFVMARRLTRGITLKINSSYLKKALMYGLQIHISTVLRFLSVRVNLLLVNGFLNPAAVGFYSVGAGLAEKLWLISQAAAAVLFPQIAAEKDVSKRREFTPIVVRTALWITTVGALLIFVLSRWLISSIFSDAFLPAVKPFQILLLGAVVMSVNQILGNDIAGRGQPMLNIYGNVAGFIAVIVFSILWTPRYGIEGAAWASTVSYICNFVIQLFFYTRISGNSLKVIFFPRKTDWILYWQIGKTMWQWASKVLGIVDAIGRGKN